jgi:hypothetical protein
MNQRIQLLAEQAGAVFEKTNGLNDCPQDSLVDDEIQKFAELIVRECIEVADKNRTGMEIKSNTHLTADAIKQHFGVEE